MANTDSRCARRKVRSISSLASLAWPVPTSYPFGRKSQKRVPEGSATRAARPRPWSDRSMTLWAFEPGRIRLARELKGWSQAELARALAVTAAAISQFEAGASRPSGETRRRLAEVLDVPPDFLDLPLVDTHEGFFRSLRRTSVVDRRRARALAQVAHDLVSLTELGRRLPPPSVPDLETPPLVEDRGAIEKLAAEVRRYWKLGKGPAPDVVELLESHGVVVMRLPIGTADVDAFSLPLTDRPVVVLGTDKGDKARSRFDAAHELGHLAMHGEQVRGLPVVEKQAHEFAAAFLMPEADIRAALPSYADWPTLFELKMHWQVSLAALLMRARTLGRMSESNYIAAVKTASTRGWRRVEPVPLGEPEQPRTVRDLLNADDGAHARKLLPAHAVDSNRESGRCLGHRAETVLNSCTSRTVSSSGSTPSSSGHEVRSASVRGTPST